MNKYIHKVKGKKAILSGIVILSLYILVYLPSYQNTTHAQGIETVGRMLELLFGRKPQKVHLTPEEMCWDIPESLAWKLDCIIDARRIAERNVQDIAVENQIDETLVYYSQCESDLYPAPWSNTLLEVTGDSICYGGCGVTTIAMIVASYKDAAITPANMAALFNEHKWNSTLVTDRRKALESNGIFLGPTQWFKTGATINDVATELKFLHDRYGYTFMLSGTYTNRKGETYNHVSWVVDIDRDYNVWVLDPAYGNTSRGPINYSVEMQNANPVYRFFVPVNKIPIRVNEYEKS